MKTIEWVRLEISSRKLDTHKEYLTHVHVSEKFPEVGMKEDKVESVKEVVQNRPWCPDLDLNTGRHQLSFNQGILSGCV